MYCKLPWTYLLDSLGRRHRSWRLLFVFYLPVSIIWPNWRPKVIGHLSRLAKTADCNPSDFFLRNYQVTFSCGLSWENIHLIVMHYRWNGRFHCSSHLDMWTKFRSIFSEMVMILRTHGLLMTSFTYWSNFQNKSIHEKILYAKTSLRRCSSSIKLDLLMTS